MTAPTPPTPDLSRLIQQAADETHRAEQAAAARVPADVRGRTGPRWTRGASAIAVLAAVLVWANFLFGGAVSNDRIAADLRLLIEQAQRQVQGHLERHGELPPVLPDATLATVVRYEIEDAAAEPPRYTLSAEMRGVVARGPAAQAGAPR